MPDGIRYLYDTYHEDSICEQYIEMQRKTEKATLTRINRIVKKEMFTLKPRRLVLSNSDITRYINSFL